MANSRNIVMQKFPVWQITKVYSKRNFSNFCTCVNLYSSFSSANKINILSIIKTSVQV